MMIPIQHLCCVQHVYTFMNTVRVYSVLLIVVLCSEIDGFDKIVDLTPYLDNHNLHNSIVFYRYNTAVV